MAATRQRHVRVSETTHRTLRELADDSGEPIAALLDRAVEDYRRKLFFEQAARDWEALERDPEAVAEFEAELALWDQTVGDGLEPEEW